VPVPRWPGWVARRQRRCRSFPGVKRYARCAAAAPPATGRPSSAADLQRVPAQFNPIGVRHAGWRVQAQRAGPAWAAATVAGSTPELAHQTG